MKKTIIKIAESVQWNLVQMEEGEQRKNIATDDNDGDDGDNNDDDELRAELQ